MCNSSGVERKHHSMSQCPSFITSIPLTRRTGFLERRRLCTSLSTARMRKPAQPLLYPLNWTAVLTTRTKPATPYITVDPFKEEVKPLRNKSRPLNPIVIIPGYGAPAFSYMAFQTMLQAALPENTYVGVVPVMRRHWALTAGGRPMTPILRIVDQAVQTALAKTGASHVTLIGHSAGGWIGRVYLGDQSYPPTSSGVVYNGRRFVKQLVCLGTPHSSGEPVTRKNMSFVNVNYPGAFYDDVEYLNFGGDGVTIPPSTAPFWRFWQPLWMSRLSYRLTDPWLPVDKPAVGDGTFLSPFFPVPLFLVAFFCCH